MRRSDDEILRLLISAVMRSDLSAEEIFRLSHSLEQSSFVAKFSKIIRDVSFQLGEPLSKKSKAGAGTARNRALSAIKRRRLSKLELADIILSIDPTAVVSSRETVTSIVKTFLDSTKSENREQFLAVLEAKGDDQYLRGIRQRR